MISLLLNKNKKLNQKNCELNKTINDIINTVEVIDKIHNSQDIELSEIKEEMKQIKRKQKKLKKTFKIGSMRI